MYYQMLPRMSLEVNEQLASPAVSGEDQSVLVAGLTIYTISGTSPQVSVSLETSDDGEIWAAVGTIVTGTASGLSLGAFHVTTSGEEWGRLVRVKVAISGTSAVAEFAVSLNTHASS